MQRPYMLSCHCGAIRLEVDAVLAGLHECNCSTCGVAASCIMPTLGL